MARERIATGLKVDDIIKMPISKFAEYSEKQQKELTSRLISAANKRIKKFEAKGESSPAIRKLKESGDKLSVRGKTGKDITNEFIRARDFLRNRFSKISEYKKTIKHISKRMKQSQKVISLTFDMYDELREYDSNLVGQVEKYKELDRISRYLEETNLSRTEIIDKELQYLESLYKKRQSKTDTYDNPFKTLL